MKIYPVFYTSLLRLVIVLEEVLLGQILPLPPTVEIEGKQEYFINRIEDSRMNKRKKVLEYLIR